MANIAHLSPEIKLEIIKYLDLNDISTLFETSPLFLQLINTHRHHLLNSDVNDLKDGLLGYDSPMCLSALRLRSRHPIEPPSTESEMREAQRASLHLYRHGNSKLCLSTATGFSLVYSVRRLLVEANWIADSYAPQAWCKRQGSPSTETLVLSDDERRRLIKAAIHFEAYCRMFFVQEKILFKGSTSIRQAFFKASREDGVKRGAFYSIAYHVYDQYLTMISNVFANMSILGSLTQEQTKQTDRWQRQTGVEMIDFAQYLTRQGLNLLHKLQCMDLSAQAEFMLGRFYRVSQSQDLSVSMASKIDLYEKGTTEPRPWYPWEGIEWVSFRTEADWGMGNFFWDRERVENLGGYPGSNSIRWDEDGDW
ncbi:hypothetical protein FPOAC2_02602 [Fusarium poae]|jgi:hypothetical protein|uniref:F-box domain-containing protein n=1 Tax=Fusarium poae TaxID=36050 RepID=A0A1B8B6V0_FUSPO|nr:hypothetical protein FPOAC1_002528 [Fusarium poae]KAG8676523.1 hypothetical protein FPOAC1_002528 [Fusarium poae]OBS28468.1 hypothetical protein FPOA_02406 [Fusarium poae]